MARCPNCHAEVSPGARYCPHCGQQLSRRTSEEEQPPLPFSPWGPPVAQHAGAGAGVAAQRAEPVVGPPLSVTTVAIAVGAILLVLLVFVLIGRRPERLPVVGVKGEAINVGETTWGVAFTDDVERLDSQRPQHGEFYAVGVIIANRGGDGITLTAESVGLMNEADHARYTPTLAAWGTPEQLVSGQYSTRYALPRGEAIAGLIVFDVPKEMTEPRLLVRDLTSSSPTFTGQIDLTREKPQTEGGRSLSPRWPAL